MKKIIILSAFLIISMVGFTQNFCYEFKKGTYILKDKEFNKIYTIYRNDSLQVESDNEGTVCQFKVIWKNDCTYELRYDKTISSKEPITFPNDLVISTTITKKTQYGYEFETKSNISPMVMKGKVKRKTMR